MQKLPGPATQSPSKSLLLGIGTGRPRPCHLRPPGSSACPPTASAAASLLGSSRFGLTGLHRQQSQLKSGPACSYRYFSSSRPPPTLECSSQKRFLARLLAQFRRGEFAERAATNAASPLLLFLAGNPQRKSEPNGAVRMVAFLCLSDIRNPCLRKSFGGCAPFPVLTPLHSVRTRSRSCSGVPFELNSY